MVERRGEKDQGEIWEGELDVGYFLNKGEVSCWLSVGIGNEWKQVDIDKEDWEATIEAASKSVEGVRKLIKIAKIVAREIEWEGKRGARKKIKKAKKIIKKITKKSENKPPLRVLVKVKEAIYSNENGLGIFKEMDDESDSSSVSEKKVVWDFTHLLGPGVELLEAGERAEQLKEMKDAGDEVEKAIAELEQKVAKLEFDLTLSLEPSFPPIVPAGNEFEGLPVLKVLFPTKPSRNYPFEDLLSLNISSITIEVEVEGVSDLLIYNEIGEVDSAQPFQLFGYKPEKGSNLIIGSAEVFRKPLESVDLDIQFRGVAGMSKGGIDDGYFKGYYVEDKKGKNNNNSKPAYTSNDEYKVKFEQRVNGDWKPIGNETKLFGEDQVEKNQKLSISGFDERIPNRLEPLEGFSNRVKDGYIRMTLSAPEKHAFGFGAYEIATKRNIDENLKKAIKSRGSEGFEDENLNEPIVPVVSSIQLSYTASRTYEFKSDRDFSEQEFRFLHLFPFGIQTQSNERPFPPVSSLFFKNDSVPQGWALFGLSELTAGQELSLFFQLDRSTVMRSESDGESPEERVNYFILDGDEWSPLTVLQDSTVGFSKSGLVKVKIPVLKKERSTILPSDCNWIAIRAFGEGDLYPQTVAVLPNAGLARRISSIKDQTTLKPRQLNRSLSGQSLIKTIHQPFESFGGALEESNAKRTHRIRSQINGNFRAIQIGDFENLVLEHFPEVAQVKGMVDKEGQIKIAVIPHRPLFRDNPHPTFTQAFRHRIKEKLSHFHSPSLDVDVIDPQYIFVQVACCAEFNVSREQGETWLRKELGRYISPWRYKPELEIPFGLNIDIKELKESISRKKDQELGSFYLKNWGNIRLIYYWVENGVNWYYLDWLNDDAGVKLELKKKWKLLDSKKEYWIQVDDFGRNHRIFSNEEGLGAYLLNTIIDENKIDGVEFGSFQPL